MSAFYKITISEDSVVSVATKNNKLGAGIYNFSTLPGYDFLRTNTKGQLTDIHGTCKGVCSDCANGGCYAVRDAKLHHNACIPAWGKNTLLMRENPVKAFSQIKQILIKNHAHTLRFNVSGELEEYSWLLCLVQLAKELPDVQVYFYTKQFSFVKKFLEENGKFPDNLACNLSRWRDNLKNFDTRGCNVFAYDDGTDPELKSWVHCPAVNKNGRETGIQCKDCRRCMANKGVKTAVYAH